MHKGFRIYLILICNVMVMATGYNFYSSLPLEENQPIVDTIYGKVKGYVDFSRYNRPFYAFNGIPYAKPPVGERRFRAPEPPDRWFHVRDATKDGPMCIQVNYLLAENPPVEGSEDCLYINVYTPKLSAKYNECHSAKRLLPVMVSVPYGGFFAGTGNRDLYSPNFFMDKDVVLVSFNYRLSVFGFLSTNDDAAPGNWGFKDQLAAFKWVHDNIGAFGGDNKRVTIFGQSAGAGGIHYHLTSPATKNLFQAAITESGAALTVWGKPKNLIQAEIAKQQAIAVGCSNETDTLTMVNCIRGVDAYTLADSIRKLKIFSAEPYVIYGPVTEKQTALNPYPYITEDPLQIILKGKMHKVPWIIGVVKDEGILRAAPLLRVSRVREELLSRFDELMPLLLGLSLSVPPEEVANTWQKIKEFYFPSGMLNINDPRSVQGFIDMYSDRFFFYGVYQSSLLHAWKGHSPIWFYHFAYRGRYSYGDIFATTNENINFKWGVCHCDELLYLFPSPRFFPPLKPTDVPISNLMIQMWTDFATYRNPTRFAGLYIPKWHPLPNLQNQPTVENNNLFYLNITGPYKLGQGPYYQLQMHNEFYPERMRFWNSLPLSENINGLG